MSAEAFVKRAGKLIAAGVTPRCGSVAADGTMTEFVYEPNTAFQTPAFFTDVDRQGKHTLMISYLPPKMFGRKLYELTTTLKGSFRVAAILGSNGVADHWCLQFSTPQDFTRALNWYRGIERNHVITISFDPNQKDQDEHA